MDKRVINKFAVKARRDLINDVTLRLRALGITEVGVDDKEDRSTPSAEYYAGAAIPLEGADIGRRKRLVDRLKSQAAKNDWQTAFTDLIEEVAYTWFNRIIAIRFMEVNDYLPSGIRVLSSIEGRHEPDIMYYADEMPEYIGNYQPEELALIKKAQETQHPLDLDAMYQLLFVKQINALNENLPKLFEKTDDFMLLLFTPSYNRGVIADLVTQIPEADFDIASDDSQGQVEIIGWLYQYYNQEPHNKVVKINGGPISEQDIPAATQLFTTDWVVRYMIDNSLGRYYLEHVNHSSLANKLTYLIPGKIDEVSEPFILDRLSLLDNAMGSGHILIYAFDVLMQIYEDQGYSSRDAARQVVEKNLYGLEIDKRAYQLAYFALMMKVRQYDRRALQKNLTPNLFLFEDSQNLTDELLQQLKLPNDLSHDLAEIRDAFISAKTLGSIIRFDKQYDIREILDHINSLEKASQQTLFLDDTVFSQIQGMLQITAILQHHFEIVVTNPPYLNRMNKVLKDYVKKYYKNYSGDLFSVFIWRNIALTRSNGYSAYMTPFVWMFIKTYQALRADILKTATISSLIQMEYSAFEEATVPIDTFVLKKSQQPSDLVGSYIKLSDFKGGMQVQGKKVREAISDPQVDYLYRTNQTNFEKIPGSPIAYWASENLIHDFEIGQELAQIVEPRVGLQTGDNKLFLRQWFEVAQAHIKFDATSLSDAIASGKKWFPYNKGGAYRKWYGNYDYVVNWQNDGQEIKNFKDANGKLRSRPQNTDFYFREAITWSDVTSGIFAARYRKQGSIHDVTGMSAFGTTQELYSILPLLNSKVANYVFKMINPTIHLQIGNLQSFPFILSSKEESELSNSLTRSNINIESVDWDSFETSWDFTTLPMLAHIAEHNRNWTVEAAFNEWTKEAENRFNQLKSNEEELNRIFIDLYGLQDELTPEVADKDISVRKADRTRDVKAFLSYFIGATFGRYSIDTPGVAFAGGEWNDDNYSSYQPNTDNVILLTDNEIFNDDRDIIFRLKDFLSATFGQANLADNLEFIASSLGKKGKTSEEQIRKYFVDDFFKKDHLSTYQKRPIYWQLASGKQDGFKALLYLHRYDENTLAMIRTAYLHPLQEAYTNRMAQLQRMVEAETETRQRNQMSKEINKLEKQIDEIVKYDATLQHVANMHIELDLDDGVLVNYEKVQGGQKLLTPLK
ncbi:BREX-1 system adenine-specific DNA-methyltransferase PglX [Lacticaseibacillus saniviri]